jgi:hypothetical protein
MFSRLRVQRIMRKVNPDFRDADLRVTPHDALGKNDTTIPKVEPTFGIVAVGWQQAENR